MTQEYPSIQPVDININIPISSLQGVPDDTAHDYLVKNTRLPKTLQAFLTSPKVGAQVKKLAQKHDNPAIVAVVSFALVLITVGDLAARDLPQFLRDQLEIDADAAQPIATAIERDILSSVTLNLNQYHTQLKQKNKPQASAPTEHASRQLPNQSNILNLRSKYRLDASPNHKNNPPKPPRPPHTSPSADKPRVEKPDSSPVSPKRGG